MGPTWPNSQQLNNNLLSTLTREVVIGSTGVRVILGDFNRGIDQLEEFRLWEQHGWREVQHYANAMWDQEIRPTCKAATTVDLVWLSPEALMLCKSVGTKDVFCDHTTVFAELMVPEHPQLIHTWPKPSIIPWEEIDIQQWHDSFCTSQVPHFDGQDTTAFYAGWAKQWETSLHRAHPKMPPNTLGRAQRTSPHVAAETPACSKPSRVGEVHLKSDLVSTQVHQWFRQLRRLQSYKHAALAAKPTPAAESYRIDLWAAILRAKGFSCRFDQWWPHREHKSPQSPTLWPNYPPDGDLATTLFDDFNVNFKKFELWHLRQRQKILKSKHEKGCRQLFHELKDPQRDQLDLLWQHHTFTVLDFDETSGQIHLDGPAPSRGTLIWHHEGKQLPIESTEQDIIVCDDIPLDFAPGDALRCTQMLSSTEELHLAMMDLWKPRWQKTSKVGSEDWQRIISFFQAYMPRMDFPSPEVTLDNWKSTLKRFPTRPARGADAISVQDLQNLPDASTEGLLSLLGSLDGAKHEWPQQLLLGLVINLSKRDDAHLPSHYRPVVIFSCIYRAWARLCASPLLQLLGQRVPSQAFGFLPHRECAQIWLELQAFVELGIQQGISLTGFGADLEKCFNNVGRDQLQQLATHIGFSDDLVGPWFAFLNRCQRSFQIRTTLSPMMTSTQGLPEGCSLSVVGMVLIDWSYHIYMTALCPRVHAYSYVDNLSMISHHIMDLISSFFSTIAYFDLWGLELDGGKTYFWGTDAKDQKLLKLLGLSLKSDASELGGSLCFGASRRNRLLKARGAKLAPKWTRLQKSLAPMNNKLRCLPVVFWPAALYGSPVCLVASSYFHQLRKMANKSLRLNKAGSNSKLRFTMSDNPETDPEYFHILSVFRTMRRVCGRSRRLLDCWQLWFRTFDSKVTSGPFSVLLQVLHTLGWMLLDPPLFQDHSGHTHDLFLIPWTLLCTLVDDAWLLHISHELRERGTMTALYGIDRHASLHQCGRLTPYERGLVSSLQSGAFIDAWIHGKFDKTKTGLCSLCKVPETHEHLLICPKFEDSRQECGIMLSEFSQWPTSVTHHLLLPRAPCIDDLREYFLSLEDDFDPSWTSPANDTLQHLFTDGSCFHRDRPELSQAAWSVFLANTTTPIATGWLPGLPQTIGRAELRAMLVALRWIAHWRCASHVWTDSQYVHTGLQRRLNGYKTKLTDSNGDLWLQVDALLTEICTLVDSSWVPSHLDEALCETPMEDWISRGNGCADSLAVRQNQTRSIGFQTLLTRQQEWDVRATDFLHRLRSYYFQVYEKTRNTASVAPIEIADSDSEDEGFLYSFLDVLGEVDFSSLELPAQFPSTFVESLISWIQEHEGDEVPILPVSFVELAVGLVKLDPIAFPRRSPTAKQWDLIYPGNLFERPTLTFYHRIVQSCGRYLSQQCNPSPLLRSLDRTALGIHFPVEGLLLRIKPAFLAQIKSVIVDFTHSRPIRRQADMARPL